MSSSGSVPYINSRISLVAKSGVRYEGTLYAIDPKESTVALANVRSFGTEDRRPENPVPPANELYEYIIFKGSDIQDLTIMSAPPAPEPAPFPGYQQPSQFGAPSPFPGAPQQQGFGQFGYPGASPFGYPPYGGPMYPPGFGGQWGAQYPPYARPPGLAPPANSMPRGPQPASSPMGASGAPASAPQPAAPAPSAPAPTASASAPAPAPAAATPAPTAAPASAPSDASAAAPSGSASATPASSAPVAFAIKDKAAEAASQGSATATAAESKPTGAGRGSAPSKRYEVKRTPNKPGDEAASTAGAAPEAKPAQRNQAQSWAQKIAPAAPAAEQSQTQSQQSQPSSRPKQDNRPQQDNNRRQQRNRHDGERGRGRGGRGGGRGGRSDLTAAELRRTMQDDFDLEKANAAFDKESLMAEIEAERTKLGHDKSEESVAYNPAVSIFDTISSEVLEKHAAAEDGSRRPRDDAHKERRLNQETFGETTSVRFHRGRGNRGGRGRRGGQQGNGVSNRPPRDNTDPNVRGRQRPHQPQNRSASTSKSQNQNQ